MKIALVDNANNNFFAITRYFRDLGVDAHLYTISKSKKSHFEPENDTFKDVLDCTWIRKFPISYKWYNYFVPIKRKLSIFKKYDYIITCGRATGLFERAGFKTDLFIPFGGDLFNEPFLRFPQYKEIVKFIPRLLIRLFASHWQSKGITNSKFVLSNTNWETAENALKTLNKQAINLPRLMIYLENSKFQNVQSLERKWNICNESDFVVFSPTRHLWKTNADPMSDFHIHGGMKRNDKLIKAFAKIVHNSIYQKPLLILFDYGADVKYSKILINDLKINEYVQWMPITPRKEILLGMSKATFVADQFRIGMSATSAGTTNEALAVGVPVITNTDGAIFDSEDPYFQAPILQALSENEIYHYFLDYSKRPKYYHHLGCKSKKWFNDHLGIGLAKKYLQLL